ALSRIHLRWAPDGVADLCRPRFPPDSGNGGVLRHVRRHLVRVDLHAGLLRGGALVRLDRAPQGAGAGVGAAPGGMTADQAGLMNSPWACTHATFVDEERSRTCFS